MQDRLSPGELETKKKFKSTLEAIQALQASNAKTPAELNQLKKDAAERLEAKPTKVSEQFEQNLSNVAAQQELIRLKNELEATKLELAETKRELAYVRSKWLGAEEQIESVSRQIAEFYSVQTNFHRKINNFVQACKCAATALHNEKDQQAFLKCLQPYIELRYGPFSEKPTGNIARDVADITSVINDKNISFLKMLEALFLTVTHLEEMNALLSKIHQNKKAKEIMLAGIDSTSWLDVIGHASMPFQNLMRYELLLRDTVNAMVKAGYPPTDRVLKEVMAAFAGFSPKLLCFNKYQDTLVDLLIVDNFIVGLSRKGFLKDSVVNKDQGVTEKDGEAVEQSGNDAATDPVPEEAVPVNELTLQTELEAIGIYIAGAKSQLARKVYHPAEMHQGLLRMLEQLRSDIEGPTLAWREKRLQEERYLDKGYRLLVSASATVFGKEVLFDEPEKDPLDRLDELINIFQVKLAELTERKKGEDLNRKAVEFIREMEGKAVDGQLDPPKPSHF